MKLVRRVLIGAVRVVIMLAIVFAGIYFVAPIALSFYAARKAPAVVRVVPTDLKDHSVSLAPATKLSYLGHDFEVPWTDFDAPKTVLYPKDKPEKTRVVLTFQSGLRIMVTSIPPREFAAEFATDFKVPAQQFDAFFGNGKGASDYDFVNNIYEFTPANMHHWSLSQAAQSRDLTRLIVKSMVPVREAETGIFRVQNIDFKGFQQGDPNIRQNRILVNLYANAGEIEIAFLLKDYDRKLVTQSEINRVIQSLRASNPGPAAPQVAKRW